MGVGEWLGVWVAGRVRVCVCVCVRVSVPVCVLSNQSYFSFISSKDTCPRIEALASGWLTLTWFA